MRVKYADLVKLRPNQHRLIVILKFFTQGSIFCPKVLIPPPPKTNMLLSTFFPFFTPIVVKIFNSIFHT